MQLDIGSEPTLKFAYPMQKSADKTSLEEKLLKSAFQTPNCNTF